MHNTKVILKITFVTIHSSVFDGESRCPGVPMVGESNGEHTAEVEAKKWWLVVEPTSH